MEELKFKSFDPERTKEWARLTEMQVTEVKHRICRYCIHFDAGDDRCGQPVLQFPCGRRSLPVLFAAGVQGEGIL